MFCVIEFQEEFYVGDAVTRDFSNDSTCAKCGYLLLNKVHLPGSNMMARNVQIEAELKADGAKLFFECENCHARNEVFKDQKYDGKGAKLHLTGEIL